MSNENKDKPAAADEGAALKKLQAELAEAKKALADTKADLAAEKDARIADLKEQLAQARAAPAGPAVLMSSADAAEGAKAAAKHQKLHDMRARAMEIAGPKAQHVKYIVGPSGTVRPGLGVVKPGKVISVSIDELPAGEWKVYDPDEFEPNAQPREAKGTSEFQTGNAEKAIAQREALKGLRGA